MRQVFAPSYVFAPPSRPGERLNEAEVAREYAWQQLIRSTAGYIASERVFRERTTFFRAKHGCQDGTDTVEMLKDRDNDEQFKNAIADAPHYSRRMIAFAELFQAAGTRIDDVRSNLGLNQ